MEFANLVPNHHGSERNGIKVHSFKIDNDFKRLNEIAHVDLQQNLCHDMFLGKQITNSPLHQGSCIHN